MYIIHSTHKREVNKMTMIATPEVPTKKVLKTKVGEDARFLFEETSMFGAELVPKASVTVTNHPKRSWFARVTVDADYKITRVE
jgi:hypothetical protein